MTVILVIYLRENWRVEDQWLLASGAGKLVLLTCGRVAWHTHYQSAQTVSAAWEVRHRRYLL